MPAGAAPTQPYYLREKRTDDVYRWADDDPKGLPFAPPLLVAEVTLDIGGVEVVVSRPAQFRVGDSVRGELRRDVDVVPAVAVGLDSSTLDRPAGNDSVPAETHRPRHEPVGDPRQRHA